MGYSNSFIKNADFIGINIHQNIIKNFVMQHKFKNAELKNAKVVYKYLLIIFVSLFIMSFDIAKTIEQELAKIKGTSDTNSRLGQMENLIMKLKEHLQKTKKTTEQVISESEQIGGKKYKKSMTNKKRNHKKMKKAKKTRKHRKHRK